MTGLFGLQDYQLWLIAAAALGVAEMIIPGVFLIWVGAAAAITGALAFLLPFGWPLQVLIFASLSVISVYAGRGILNRNPILTADPLLNDKASRLIGSVVTAVEPVDAFHGRVKVGDGVWSAKGAEAAVGDRLRVAGVEGTVLVVERV